jgi:hypothetical protein
MAGGAICTQANRHVTRIDGLVKVLFMAGEALCGRAGIPVEMTVNTICCGMRSCKRKVRLIVIERTIGISGRVARKAGRVGISVPRDTVMCIVCFRVSVAGDTAELSVVIVVGMTIAALHPFTFMRARVDREV